MLQIRTLKEDELNLLFLSSQNEAFDVEELHLRCQYKIHPQDFFIAHKGSSLIGFIVALRQSENFGFISTFLVLKEFRKKGYGTQILNFALQHLQERQVALDSTLNNTNIYTKFGFKSYFDVHTFVYITTKHKAPKTNLEFIDYDKFNSLNKQNEYLKCLLSNKDTHYKAIHNKNITTSYGLSFKHKEGYKIVIDSNDYAEVKAIFFELVKGFSEGYLIYIEATKLNPVLLNLANDLKMIEYSRFARMYNKIL